MLTAGSQTNQHMTNITQDLLDVRLPHQPTYRGHMPDENAATQTFTQKAIEKRLAKYAKTGVSGQVRDELGAIEEKMSMVRFLILIGCKRHGTDSLLSRPTQSVVK